MEMRIEAYQTKTKPDYRPLAEWILERIQAEAEEPAEERKDDGKKAAC